MGILKPLSGVIKLTLPIETPVIHVQGGFKVPMETGRNLKHTTERHQRGFKVPMETGSMMACCQFGLKHLLDQGIEYQRRGVIRVESSWSGNTRFTADYELLQRLRAVALWLVYKLWNLTI